MKKQAENLAAVQRRSTSLAGRQEADAAKLLRQSREGEGAGEGLGGLGDQFRAAAGSIPSQYNAVVECEELRRVNGDLSHRVAGLETQRGELEAALAGAKGAALAAEEKAERVEGEASAARVCADGTIEEYASTVHTLRSELDGAMRELYAHGQHAADLQVGISNIEYPLVSNTMISNIEYRLTEA
jgi:hypothetical protein